MRECAMALRSPRHLAVLVLGFGVLPASLAAQEMIREPKVDGVRVDWCLSWGADCGQPAADELCRRQGFEKALSFEVAGQVGPTVILGSGKTCSNCDGFLYVVCGKEGQKAPPGPLSDLSAVSSEKPWRYAVLAQGKVVAGANPLLDIPSIDVKGFRSARIFLHVMEFSPERSWKLPKEARLRVEGRHEVQGRFHPYHEAQILMKEPAELSGWVEIPVVGPTLRLVVSGEHLPKSKMYVDCTLYLLD